MNKFDRIIIIAVFLVISIFSNAQNNVGINPDGSLPDPSAALDVVASDKGLLIPRLTSVQRVAIPNPANGLVVYDTDSLCFFFFRVTSNLWVSLCSDPIGCETNNTVIKSNGVSTVCSQITDNGISVGINNVNPDSTALLDVNANNQGVLFPRLTSSQKNSIVNPATGLTIYCTTDSVIEFFDGTCWRPSYSTNCDNCNFQMSLNHNADTVNMAITDSATVQLTINQNSGNPQNIVFSVLGNIPEGLTYTIGTNPMLSSGTTDITFHASPITPAGTYTYIIVGFCGSTIHSLIYTLTITPCYQVQVLSYTTNFDLSQAFYAAYPSAPHNSPVCVECIIGTGIYVASDSTNIPAFTTGVLPAGSHVSIVNYGNIIGKGGDGGIAWDPAQGWTGAGLNGGNAIDLTINSTILNYSYIFGGGGGGDAMAFSYSYLIPVVNITFGIFVGAGGGGGAGGGIIGGAGGNVPNMIGILLYSPGSDGTTSIFGLGGAGGDLNYPFPFQQGPVIITITPDAKGGTGGNYGANGTQGHLSIFFSVSMEVNIPFVGPVIIPLVNNLSVPIPFSPPPWGIAGYAVKTNGFTTNIQDNTYNTSSLKGKVGP